MKKRTLVSLVCILLAFTLCPIAALAADYPNQTVEMIVCSTAGGGSDVLARALAESLEMPETMVIVNRAGAGGTIGTMEVSMAKPDGYTLLLGMVGPFETQPHLLDVQYSIDDFRYIAGLTEETFFVAVKTDSGITNIDELKAAYADKTLMFGSSSTGSVPHLAQEYLFKEIGLNATHIPFNGSNDAIVSLLGGHIDSITAQYGELVSFVNSGELRLLATYSPERVATAPEVPTLKEQNVDVAISAIKFVAAPKDTPDEIVAYLSEAIETAKLSDSFQTYLTNTQSTVCNLDEAAIKAQLTAESDIYGELIRTLGLDQQ